jgi:putative ABC transport system substrate-binding protein
MKRRAFITLLGSAVAWPLAARAQQPRKNYRVGLLWDSPTVFSEAMEAFRQALRDLGYVEGRTLVIEYRWAEGKPERMRELAEELVRLNVDVIVAPSSIYTAAAKQAPRQFRSFSSAMPTRSEVATWRASRSPAEMPPGSR